MGGGAGSGGRGVGRRGVTTTVPTHANFMASTEESYAPSSFFLLSAPLSFTLAFLSFVIFLGARHIFLGEAWAEGKGALTKSRHRTDSGQETDCT